MSHHVARFWSVMAAWGMLGACGGTGGPAAPAPASGISEPSRPAVRPEPVSAPSAAASASANPAAPASAQAAPSPPSDEPSPYVSQPHDIVCGENTSYAFNFRASDVGVRAEKKCRASTDDNPQAYSQCMDTARDKVGVTVLRCLKKDKTWWWVTYERRGKDLVTLHRFPVQFAEETQNSLALRPTDKDTGLAPFARVPQKIVIRLPNEYSIELDDATHGKLVYDAKIGMIQQ
jgi:hypothetical protein